MIIRHQWQRSPFRRPSDRDHYSAWCKKCGCVRKIERIQKLFYFPMSPARAKMFVGNPTLDSRYVTLTRFQYYRRRTPHRWEKRKPVTAWMHCDGIWPKGWVPGVMAGGAVTPHGDVRAEEIM